MGRLRLRPGARLLLHLFFPLSTSGPLSATSTARPQQEEGGRGGRGGRRGGGRRGGGGLFRGGGLRQ